MAKNEQMLRLKLMGDLLRQRKTAGATFSEIEQYLTNHFEDRDIADKLRFTERTFMRDKKAMLEVFGIEISYSRAKNVYYISEEELELAQESVYDQLLLVEAYRQTRDRSDLMFFEPRKPRGLHHLSGLLHAIINRKIVRFSYEKFHLGERFPRVVEPYALKEFRHRWYLLGRIHQAADGNDVMLAFGLDRIWELELTTKSFTRDHYDCEKEFRNAYGITSVYGETPQKVRLTFDRHQGQYIKAMPLHHSQRLLSENDEDMTFELTLVPTYDFERELLSHGERLKAVWPDSLRETLRAEAARMLEQFSLPEMA